MLAFSNWMEVKKERLMNTIVRFKIKSTIFHSTAQHLAWFAAEIWTKLTQICDVRMIKNFFTLESFIVLTIWFNIKQNEKCLSYWQQEVYKHGQLRELREITDNRQLKTDTMNKVSKSTWHFATERDHILLAYTNNNVEKC